MHADFDAIRLVHEDDLLTAGLGVDGLRAPAPEFADPAAPTPAELRRRAIHASWQGIALLRGDVSLPRVPGVEAHAFARVPGASQPHRVAVQIPAHFDRARRCVVVAPASGSRGVFGAIAVGGAWALPRGFAVAYTDKGCGSDYVDCDVGESVGVDGVRIARGDEPLAFDSVGGDGIAIKHAHSGDNPERDWGRHVRQAAEFALRMLAERFPDDAPFDVDTTTIIAVGLSNGGAAVLRAAELDGDWLDAVVAAASNVHVESTPPAYDYATEAALLMPAALVHLDAWPAGMAMPSVDALADAGGACSAREAHARLRGRGWTDAALRGGAFGTAFGLWASIAATYASAYGRFAAGDHPTGWRFAATDAQGNARCTTPAERAAWWCDAAGIAPGAGVSLLRPAGDEVDALRALRSLWTGTDDAGERVRRGIGETRCGPPSRDLPMIVIHGLADGLIPAAFSSAPYVDAARRAGRAPVFWQVEHAQHFDAFLALPGMATRYVPLVPCIHAALDRVAAHLFDGEPMPGDAVINARPG